MTKGIKILGCLLLLYIPLIITAADRQDIIRGRVLNAGTDLAIEGVSIGVVGESLETITDRQGRFSLPIGKRKSIRLIISHIGFLEEKVEVGASREIIIHLRENKNDIEEVVVSTGYSTAKQRHLTGSFEHINEELFNRQISTDVLSRLDGVANGLLFDKRSSSAAPIQIRGLSTLTGDISRPLIILDNFPYEGDVENINPNDIESVTVLKDAAAAAIWGARAGNGVIVLTSKSGVFNKQSNVSVTSNIGITARPNLFYEPQMTTSDFIDIERFLFEKGEYNWALNDRTSWPVVTPVVEILNKEVTGIYSEAEAKLAIDALRQLDVRDDLSKYLYRNAINQQYNLRLSGGAQRSHYNASVGYDRNLRSEVGNEYDRLSLRTSNTYRFGKGLDLDLGLAYTASKTVNNNPGEIRTAEVGGTLYPYARLVNESGNAAILERNYRLAFVDTVGSGKLLDWHYRPLDEITASDNTNHTHDMLLNVGLKYSFLSFFDASVKYQYHSARNKGQRHYSLDSWYARNLINRFTQIAGENTIYIVPNGGILDESTGTRSGHSFRTQLNFIHHGHKDHAINAFMGAEVRNHVTDNSNSRVYGYDERYLTHQSVDYINRYPIYDGLSSNSLIPYNVGLSGFVNRAISMYLNGTYSYKNRYVLTGSARRDASNLFGTDTNNKWKPLWSLGVAWEVSNEPFYKLEALPYLKLRATQGYTGNVNNSLPALTTLEFRSLSSKTRLPYAVVANPPNPSLRWEQVLTRNIGLDFATRNQRISGSIEYYNRKSTDVISAEPADITTGFIRLTKNSAQLRNTGMDISLTGANLRGAFSWNTNVLFSLNKTKVERYLLEAIRPSSMVGNGNTISPIVGRGAYNIVSYRTAGLDPENGNPQGYVGGEISSDYRDIIDNATKYDLAFHGSATPQKFGAVRNTFSYRGVSISFNLSYRYDYYFRRSSISYLGLYGGVVGHADYYQRWQKPGDEMHTFVPSADYPVDSRRDQFFRDADVLVERGDHIRLQDINLSYSISNAVMERTPFKRLTVTGYISNIGVIWTRNSLNIDPDFNEIPLPTSYTFGLKAEF